jgi:hypothetical protein
LVVLRWIKLGIIPFGVELLTAPQNAFMLFDDELAVVETFVGETMHHADEAAADATAIDSLAREAWYDEQARQLMVRASEELGAGRWALRPVPAALERGGTRSVTAR